MLVNDFLAIRSPFSQLELFPVEVIIILPKFYFYRLIPEFLFLFRFIFTVFVCLILLRNFASTFYAILKTLDSFLLIHKLVRENFFQIEFFLIGEFRKFNLNLVKLVLQLLYFSILYLFYFSQLLSIVYFFYILNFLL